VEWLSIKQARHRMGVTPQLLYRLIDECQLPAYRIGNRYRLRTADVEAFIDASRVQPGTLTHLW
jgi:excisionase family DNA binding protein